MKNIVIAFILALALAASPALAHHPAAEMVDADIYAMIDELVADTPHATLVFDEEMGQGMNSTTTTTITVPSVSDAEDLVTDYLLAALSLLDDDVEVTITFGADVEAAEAATSEQTDTWTERDDWGREVIITVDSMLCVPDDEFIPGEMPERAQCIEILNPQE